MILSKAVEGGRAPVAAALFADLAAAEPVNFAQATAVARGAAAALQFRSRTTALVSKQTKHKTISTTALCTLHYQNIQVPSTAVVEYIFYKHYKYKNSLHNTCI